MVDKILRVGYNICVMAKVYIDGKENRTTQPSFYIPNRLDNVALHELEAVLGGKERVAYMVEEMLQPDAGIRGTLSRRKTLTFNFRQCNIKKLREQLIGLLQQGRDVVFVPGRPVCGIGTISDIPMPFMMQMAALHIAPVPVFVGFYNKDVWNAFTNDPKSYDYATLTICPKLTPGPQTGERVLEAWYSASAASFQHHPLLERSVPQLIVEGIRKHPNVQMVDGMDHSALPHYKLLGVAMALARKLKQIVEEPRLGILLPPGKGGLIANYACLLAGIVPVNINYTSSEAAFHSIVRQAGLKHFISARAFMSKLPQFPWPEDDQILHLDKLLKSLGMAKIAPWVAFARVAPASAICKTFALDKRSGNDEAALLFTSGSSGEPKGVPLTHRMVIANMLQALSRAALPPARFMLCSLPIFHSFGFTVCTMLPVCCGIGMVTYPSPLDAKVLNELIEKYQCSVAITTPTFARGMLRRAHEHTYDSLKYFIVGAEKLQPALAEEFMNKCHVKLLEGYGLTETSPVCCVNLEEYASTDKQPFYMSSFKPGSIGVLFPGMGIRITDPDDDNKHLPLSEQGMIWFKGANVFSGYIDRPELNAEIFKDGWFKTGDLGCMDLNGFITLGGRRSRFSKVAGEMVPHEVVENAIEESLTYPEGFVGRGVVVMGVPDKQKGEALVLLSALHSGRLADALDEIREVLVSKGIPRLWCPREIIPVEAIPVLPTGKLDLRGCQLLANEALGL